MAAIEKAIFFDNDASRLEQVHGVCRDIRLVAIPETNPFYESSLHVGVLGWFYYSLLSDNNLYAHALLNNNINFDFFDPVAGIEEEHIEQLRDWIEETNDTPNRAALFDWDRTITVIEGYRTLKSLTSSYNSPSEWFDSIGKTYEDFKEDTLIYLCGGNERLQMLRNMFQMVHEKGISLFVLTNNTGCGTPEFTELMKKLFGALPVRSICGKFFDFHKGMALREHRQFATLCAPRGGRRRRRATRKCRKTLKKC